MNITRDHILPLIKKHKVIFHAICIAIFILIGYLSYNNIFDNTFHFDDSVWRGLEQVNNEDYAGLIDFNTFRVIPFATLTHNYHAYGNDTSGYYYVNLSIHLINTILVYSLLLLILKTPVIRESGLSEYKYLIAFFGALIFLLHPIQTQAVSYVYQRLASIAAMFYILTCVLYISARLNKKTAISILLYLLALISLIGAVFSKENTFTLPIAVVLIELFLLNKNLRIRKSYILGIIVIIAALAFFAIFVYGLDYIFLTQTNSYGETITSETYFLTQFKVILKYWRLLFLPYGQHLDHYIPLSHSFLEVNTLIAFIFNLVILGAGILLFKKHRLLSFGIFWIYLTLSIESSIIPIRDVMFEHRLYLPMIGFVLIVMYLIFKLLSKKYLDYIVIFLIALITLYSYLTYQRNRVWQNDGTLWTDTIRKSTENPRAWNNRGLYFMKKNKYNVAERDFSKAIELYPDYAEPYSNRGTAYFFLKEYYKSLEDLNKCVELKPKLAESYLNRSNIFMVLQDFESAVKDLEMLKRLKPDEDYAYHGLARCYRNLKQWDKAIAHYEKYVKTNPKAVPSYINLALCYLKIKDNEKALSTLDNAININPDNAKLHFQKGELLRNFGRHREAYNEYMIVLNLDPNYPNLNNILDQYRIEK